MGADWEDGALIVTPASSDSVCKYLLELAHPPTLAILQRWIGTIRLGQTFITTARLSLGVLPEKDMLEDAQ